MGREGAETAGAVEAAEKVACRVGAARNLVEVTQGQSWAAEKVVCRVGAARSLAEVAQAVATAIEVVQPLVAPGVQASVQVVLLHEVRLSARAAT